MTAPLLFTIHTERDNIIKNKKNLQMQSVTDAFIISTGQDLNQIIQP